MQKKNWRQTSLEVINALFSSVINVQKLFFLSLTLWLFRLLGNRHTDGKHEQQQNCCDRQQKAQDWCQTTGIAAQFSTSLNHKDGRCPVTTPHHNNPRGTVFTFPKDIFLCWKLIADEKICIVTVQTNETIKTWRGLKTRQLFQAEWSNYGRCGSWKSMQMEVESVWIQMSFIRDRVTNSDIKVTGIKGPRMSTEKVGELFSKHRKIVCIQ